MVYLNQAQEKLNDHQESVMKINNGFAIFEGFIDCFWLSFFPPSLCLLAKAPFLLLVYLSIYTNTSLFSDHEVTQSYINLFSVDVGTWMLCWWKLQSNCTAIGPKRGHLETIAPLAIGLIMGANVLVPGGGAFSGASMNPARAFGPALLGWRLNNHWIYWLGGAALSGLIYEFRIIQPEALPHQYTILKPTPYSCDKFFACLSKQY